MPKLRNIKLSNLQNLHFVAHFCCIIYANYLSFVSYIQYIFYATFRRCFMDNHANKLSVLAPLSGEIIALEQVPDPEQPLGINANLVDVVVNILGLVKKSFVL